MEVIATKVRVAAAVVEIVAVVEMSLAEMKVIGVVVGTV